MNTNIFNLLIFWHCSVVYQGVVIQEQSARDVECNEHIDAVVLMSSEDEEDSKTITQPGECMKEDNSTRSVLSYKEV